MAEMETIWRAFLAMRGQKTAVLWVSGLLLFRGNQLLWLSRERYPHPTAATCAGLLQATMESPHKLVLSILKHN